MTTNITTTTETTTVVVEENIVRIELNNVGVQGTPGLSGVVAVTSPITNSGSAGSAIVGINQALLSITKSQVSDFTSGTVTSASTAQQSGTAVFATNAATAVFATTAGTSTTISGTITKSQVSDFTSGTVTSASTAQQSGTAVFATTSGSAVTITGTITRSQVSDFTSGTVAEATNASTAVNVSGSAITRSQISDFSSGTVTSASTAQQAGTAVFATNAATAVFATTSGTSVSISGSITRSQVSDYAAGTVANISGTVAQSQVTNLTSDLALKAPLASPTFSGTVTFPFTNSGIVYSGTAGAISVSAAAPGLGYIPYTAPVTGSYAWQDISLVARDNVANAFTVGGQSITSEGTAVVPLVLKGASGQTAFLTEWQNSGGTVLASVSNVGHLRTTSLRFSANNGTIEDINGVSPYVAFTTGNIRFDARTSTFIPLVVRGAASQSANLQEWQNSAGTVLSRISSSGQIVTTQSMVSSGDVVSTGGAVKAFNGLVTLGGVNSGGFTQMTKQTAATTNPGAGIGSIYFRDGTTAGTLKLVVRAGAAGAETTILDNIPT